MSEHAELIERLEYAENYTMDCGRCGGCGELDAGGAPCPGGDGRGYLTAKTLCFEAADAISSSQAEIERLREALAEIAKQQLRDEMPSDPIEGIDADWENGYECCVRRARSASMPSIGSS